MNLREQIKNWLFQKLEVEEFNSPKFKAMFTKYFYIAWDAGKENCYPPHLKIKPEVPATPFYVLNAFGYLIVEVPAEGIYFNLLTAKRIQRSGIEGTLDSIGQIVNKKRWALEMRYPTLYRWRWKVRNWISEITWPIKQWRRRQVNRLAAWLIAKYPSLSFIAQIKDLSPLEKKYILAINIAKRFYFHNLDALSQLPDIESPILARRRTEVQNHVERLLDRPRYGFKESDFML